jgi:hypothetical protein
VLIDLLYIRLLTSLPTLGINASQSNINKFIFANRTFFILIPIINKSGQGAKTIK